MGVIYNEGYKAWSGKNASKPKPIGPSDKVRIQLPPGCVMFGVNQIDAYITGVTHNMSSSAGWGVTVDWVAAEDPGVRGTARTSDLANLVEGVVLTADTAEKNYESSPYDGLPSYFANGGLVGSSGKTYAYTPKAKPQAQADLSQIAADLAKLPKSPPWEQSSGALASGYIDPGALVSESTASELLQNYLKPHPFLKPAMESTAKGLSADLLTYDDFKEAFGSVTAELNEALSDNQKQTQATAEQIAKFGEVYLDAADGSVIPIGTGEYKLAHDNMPLGKVTDLKTTDAGLEFSVELKDLDPDALFKLYGVPPTAYAPTYAKGFGKNKKLQEANDEQALNHASAEACMVLLKNLSPDTPSLSAGNTLNIIRKIQLPNGEYVEVLMQISKKSIVPYQKEEAP